MKSFLPTSSLPLFSLFLTNFVRQSTGTGDTTEAFGFPQIDAFACPLNFTSNACGDGAEHDEIYESYCYGSHICRPLGPLSCSTCSGNPDPGYHVFVRDFDSSARGTSPLRWRVAYPGGCTNCPVMVFVPTRAAKVALEEYDQLVEQVVSLGMVVVIMTSTTVVPFDIFYPDLVDKMNPIFDYIIGGDLATEMQTQGSTPKVDKLIYGGHGQGARIAIQRFIENSCTGNIFGLEECECEGGRVGGIVMLSPTEDISTQADVGNGLVIQDNVNIAWTSPGLLINGLFDHIQGSGGTGFCSPLAISDDHFYENWDGPIWRLTFDNFGHHDISEHDESGVLCKRTDIVDDLSKPSTPPGIPLTRAHYKNLYRRSVAGAVFAFVDGVINGNAESFLAIQTELDDNTGYGFFDRQDLQILASRRNVPANVATAGVTAGCAYRGRLFSDEIQSLLYASYALAGIAIVFGLPYLYYKWIWKPIQKMKEEMPDQIRKDLEDENLMKPTKNKTKNPTFKDGLQKLTTPVTPPPGMDDGLSAISSVRGSTMGDGDESVVPYSTAGNSVRMSAQTRKEDDDIF